ncbi:neutral amino acid uniporter 4-like [Ylistrum balloti]|uniref:neutral amino acid uniporter 4-like n=1 Tax=Ylistrum balloti TaxID=509963 RepID=UPI002905CAC8|nr:neutral amino acid uniporter 4-like [Ylistrum balloti]
MSSDSTELVSLNKNDSSGNCENGFHYLSLDEHANQDSNSISQGERDRNDDTLTDFQGFMLLIPSYIGFGFLGLPYMVKLLGLWVGSGGLLLYGFLTGLGSILLAGTSQRLSERTGERFGDMGSALEMSIKLGPHCMQRHAGKFKSVFKIMVLKCENQRCFLDCCIIVNSGLLTSDLVSITSLISIDILRPYADINDTLAIVVISVMLIPVYLTRRMKLLFRLALTGNTVLLGIFAVSFQYLCQDLPDTSMRPASKRIDYITMTSFSNDVMFSYGGIISLLPIRDRMKSKKNFDGWNGLIGLVFAIIIASHVGCGFFGYLKFGEFTNVDFMLNLPRENWVFKSLAILSLLCMYCNIGMTVFVVTELIWTLVKENSSNTLILKYGEYTCRIALLVFCSTLTILVPEFQILMSLTGCFSAFLLSLFIPLVVTILTLSSDEEPTLFMDKIKRKITLIFYIFLLTFAMYSIIAGTGVAIYTSIKQIVL